LRIVLTGGGTGGHLYPGLAIVETLADHAPAEVIYVGTTQGVENRVIPGTGYRFEKVWISGLHRGEFLRNMLFPLKMVWSFFQALALLLRVRPDLILATGGYVSWPVLSAGLLLGKKIFIQEQNVKPGLVTRLFAPFARAVYLSFEASEPMFRKTSNLVVSGNPTRKALDHPPEHGAHREFRLSPDRTTLFIFGGSQGSRAINLGMMEMLNRILQQSAIQVLWSAGPRWAGEVANQFHDQEDRVSVVPYISDMASAYSMSDLVVCRAGATTVAEITRCGIASVLIPLATSAASHQRMNAELLEKEGAARVVGEDEVKTGRLEKVLISLLDDPDERKRMAQRAKKLGRPEAAEMIVKDMLGRIESEKPQKRRTRHRQ
jgi:UDP-N-acetylglucosamine--N-acetylmuramyl-(pentapeptide) pyrophosphoryl-undecaprenol N-acetylglucosamine transferase